MSEAEQLKTLTAAQKKYLSRRFCCLCEQPLHRTGCGAIYGACSEATRCARRSNCLERRGQESDTTHTETTP